MERIISIFLVLAFMFGFFYSEQTVSFFSKEDSVDEEPLAVEDFESFWKLLKTG